MASPAALPARRPSASGLSVLEPPGGWPSLGLGELWEYRELLYFFVWRDVKVRYKQTIMGASWAVLQPLASMIVFSLFFGKLAKVPSDGLPYHLFSFSGLVPWTFFMNGLNASANSLVGGGNLIKKIYFPRLALPVSSVLAGLLDFVLAFVILLAMMAFQGVSLQGRIVLVLGFLALAFVTALGAGLWLSAMNVQFRDVRYVLPFFSQLWLFVTPIVYPSSLLPENWRLLYGLNPMAGVVDGFRWALLGTPLSPPMIGISSISALFLLASGLTYFRRMERTFADAI